MSEDMLDYKKAASLLGVPLPTLRSMVSRGQIPHLRLGKRLVRFRRTSLEAWLRSKENGACIARG